MEGVPETGPTAESPRMKRRDSRLDLWELKREGWGKRLQQRDHSCATTTSPVTTGEV